MDKRSEAAEIAAQARRYVEDLMGFEGRYFIVPNEVKDEVKDSPMGSQLSAAPETRPAADELEAFRAQICQCEKCGLAKYRKNFVFGSGDPQADIMFIGEAPGADEDRQGQPFVGAAGQLLTKIIEAIRLSRDEVFICNVLKCRPPNNRDPLPEEIASCEPYLQRQIKIVQPKIICSLGRIAAQALLKTQAPMRTLRGQLHQYNGIPLIATYHPAALLRNPQWKRAVWEDVKWLRREYDDLEL